MSLKFHYVVLTYIIFMCWIIIHR